MTMSSNNCSRDHHAWSLIVPVKALDLAKSRLALALDVPTRRALVLAMLTDVLSACSQAQKVSAVTVISNDDSVAHLADRFQAKHQGEPSLSTPTNTDPVNHALSTALSTQGESPVGVLVADLPQLTSLTLDEVLASAEHHPHSVLADHLGTGSTMALWMPSSTPRIPRFGPQSAARFRTEGGACDLRELNGSDWSSARQDVDTPEDLARLIAQAHAHLPGIGAATEQILSTLPYPDSTVFMNNETRDLRRHYVRSSRPSPRPLSQP